VVFSLLLTSAVSAQEARGVPEDRALADYLGMTLQEAYAALGVPAEVFPYRGERAEHDDVVFYYDVHLYLFWYQNRVWQVRVDHRYGETALSLSMGAGRETVTAALGEPFYAGGDSLVYLLPDRGYPVRARLVFKDRRLHDVYVYRGDF
jgi:hypothetical protein